MKLCDSIGHSLYKKQANLNDVHLNINDMHGFIVYNELGENTSDHGVTHLCKLVYKRYTNKGKTAVSVQVLDAIKLSTKNTPVIDSKAVYQANRYRSRPVCRVYKRRLLMANLYDYCVIFICLPYVSEEMICYKVQNPHTRGA